MRKLFAKIHLWLSVPFGLIIIIVCLTGSILVFEKEILELCYPSRYFVKEVKERPLLIPELMSMARRQLPDSVKINGIRVTPDAERTYQLVLPARKASYFVDPYTGEITGMDDGKGFFLDMMRLHRWLLDEYKRDGGLSWGKTIVGVSTLILVFVLVSGLVIWFPRSKKALKPRLKIKTRSGWFRFLYDLHVSGGFYATLLLLAMSLTGLTWSFGWYRDAFYSVFGVPVAKTEAQAPTPAAQQKDGFRERSGRERDRSSEIDYTVWAKVMSGLQDLYPDYNTITVQNGSATVSTAKYGNTRGSDSFSFDPKTGEFTEIKWYKDLPNSMKIKGWIYSVHVGSWGGITTRILHCLISFLGAVFAVTGYYFWIRKKMRKSRS